MAKQLKQALALAQEQAAQGGQEAAQRVMQQLQQIQKVQPEVRVRRLENLFTSDGPAPEFANDADRRRHHLIQAAENLRAIGKNDMASQLMAEAEEIASDRQPREGEFRNRAEVRIERRGPEIEREVQRLRALGRLDEARAREIEIRELRGNPDELRAEMNELRSQVNDMRAMLEKVVERLEREEGEPR
jgi:hypothetical protein